MKILNRKKNKIKKGMHVLFVRKDGCQGYHNFQWVGKITAFEVHDRLGTEVAIIKPLIRSGHYNDARDDKFNDTLIEWPKFDIQIVDGLAIIFN